MPKLARLEITFTNEEDLIQYEKCKEVAKMLGCSYQKVWKDATRNNRIFDSYLNIFSHPDSMFKERAEQLKKKFDNDERILKIKTMRT